MIRNLSLVQPLPRSGAPGSRVELRHPRSASGSLLSLLALGRIRRYGTLESSLKLLLEQVIVIPVTPEIAALGAQFPHDYPGDPADRIIGGTARAEGLALVTHDERIRRSPLIKTVW